MSLIKIKIKYPGFAVNTICIFVTFWTKNKNSPTPCVPMSNFVPIMVQGGMYVQ